jgi:hypothetical protein
MFMSYGLDGCHFFCVRLTFGSNFKCSIIVYADHAHVSAELQVCLLHKLFSFIHNFIF